MLPETAPVSDAIKTPSGVHPPHVWVAPDRPPEATGETPMVSSGSPVTPVISSMTSGGSTMSWKVSVSVSAGLAESVTVTEVGARPCRRARYPPVRGL